MNRLYAEETLLKPDPGGKKYRNKKAMVYGIEFDSVHEAQRYMLLRQKEQKGEIRNLRTQVPFLLIPTQVATYPRYSVRTGKRLKDGERVLERACSYVADFVYEDIGTGMTVVEDAKSKATRTEAYRIKKKLMLMVHKIHVQEV